MPIIEKEIKRMIDKIFSEIANGQTLISSVADPEMGVKYHGYKIDNIPYINLIKDAIAPIANAKLKNLSGADQRKVLRLATSKLIEEATLKTSDIDNDSAALGATLNDALENILATYRLPIISSEASITIPTSGLTSDIIAIIDPPAGGTLLTISGYLEAGRIAYVSNVSTSGENVIINGPYQRTLLPGQSVEISYNGVGGFIESGFHDIYTYTYMVSTEEQFLAACAIEVPNFQKKTIILTKSLGIQLDVIVYGGTATQRIEVYGAGLGGNVSGNLAFYSSHDNSLPQIDFYNEYVRAGAIAVYGELVGSTLSGVDINIKNLISRDVVDDPGTATLSLHTSGTSRIKYCRIYNYPELLFLDDQGNGIIQEDWIGSYPIENWRGDNVARGGAIIPETLSPDFLYVFDGINCAMRHRTLSQTMEGINTYLADTAWVSIAGTGLYAMLRTISDTAFTIRQSSAVTTFAGEELFFSTIIPPT